jgi:hypothetical protein
MKRLSLSLWVALLTLSAAVPGRAEEKSFPPVDAPPAAPRSAAPSGAAPSGAAPSGAAPSGAAQPAPQASSQAVGGLSGATAEPSDEARREASERFQRGLRFYEDGDYSLALIEFERAHQLVPDYRVLYNVGQVAISLGRFARARVALERYLAQGGAELSEERRDAVARDLEMLRGRTAHLMVRGSPEGAELLVDDVPQGVLPLQEPLLLDAGEHRVAVRKGRHLTYTQRVVLAGAEELALEVRLEPEREDDPVVIVRQPDAPGLAPVVPRDEARSGVDPVLVGWITTGVLAGAAVTTGVLVLSADRDLDELKRRPDPSPAALADAQDRGNRWIVATDILAASAAVAAGVSLYFTLTRESSTKEVARAAPRRELQLRAVGSTLSLSGRF